jgi:retron-type reverse transcriptase
VALTRRIYANEELPIPRDPHADLLFALAQQTRMLGRNIWATVPRINWSRPNASNRARELVGIHLEGYVKQVSDLAAELGTTPERVFRNIIVWTEASSLPISRLLAEWDFEREHRLLIDLDVEAFKNITPYDSRHQVLSILLKGKGEIKLSTLERLIPRHRRVLLKAQFARLGGDRRSHQSAFIRDIILAGSRLDWAPDEHEFSECLSELLEANQVTGKLTNLDFFQLPSGLQQKVLSYFPNIFAEGEKAKAISKLRSRTQDSAIQAHQKHLSASASRWKQAGKMIRDGKLNSEEVFDCISSARKNQTAYSLLTASIKHIPKNFTPPTKHHLKLLRSAPPRPAFIAFQLIVGETALAFRSLNKASAQTYTELKRLLGPHWIAWLAEDFDINALKIGHQFSAVAKSLFVELVQRQLTSPNRDAGRLGLKNTLLGIFKLGVEPEVILIAIKFDEFGWRRLLESASFAEKIKEKENRKTHKCLVKGIKYYRSNHENQWRSVAQRTAKSLPNIIRSVAGAKLHFEELIGILNSPEAITAIKSLGSSKRRSQNTAWRKALRYWSQGKQSIPTGVLEYALDDRDLAEELIARAHSAIKAKYLKKLPLDLLVRSAIRTRALARRLDRAISRRRLLALIPWVQQTWKHQPAYGAAVELSLVFGLQNTGFLIVLSKRIRPPYDAAKQGHVFDDLYHTYKLPKKSGGTRLITAPDPKLKALQRAILDRGLSKLAVHSAAMGFVPGKSIVENARPHVDQSVVVNVDIRAFFPSTRFSLIKSAMNHIRPKSLSDRARWFLAELCSYDGGLPIGAPTSPNLANLILKPVDAALSKVARKQNAIYTRYADDITLSGDAPVPMLPFVRKVLSDYGYVLDEKKTNIFRKGRRQMVTGLVVNKKPNMARGMRRLLRAAVHHRISGKQPTWRGQPMTDQELMGRISFLNQVQPKEATSLRSQLASVLGAAYEE